MEDLEERKELLKKLRKEEAERKELEKVNGEIAKIQRSNNKLLQAVDKIKKLIKDRKR
jgi:Trp operon repressor